MALPEITMDLRTRRNTSSEDPIGDMRRRWAAYYALGPIERHVIDTSRLLPVPETEYLFERVRRNGFESLSATHSDPWNMRFG